MNAQERIEQLIAQRAQSVQREQALAEQLKETQDQILRLDGAILAYQEMMQEEQKQEAAPEEPTEAEPEPAKPAPRARKLEM